MRSHIPQRSQRTLDWIKAGAVGALLLPVLATAQTRDYRGLWVGQVALSYANEVSIPLDEDNIPIAPDPEVTTPTGDQAYIRLLLHVNGAGQVSLLKDVAILNRVASSDQSSEVVNISTLQNPINNGLAATESDIALVTDERIYGEYPPQPAIRISSAVFDFGDSRATDALDAVVKEVALAVSNSVVNTAQTDSALMKSDAKTAGSTAGTPIVTDSDVAKTFSNFLINDFKPTDVDGIAGSADPIAASGPYLVLADAVKTNSFFMDDRAVQMVNAVAAAVNQAITDGVNLTNAAHNATASYADVENVYQRFITGKNFGDMIVGAATAAAEAAETPGTTAAIEDAVNNDPGVNDVRTEALQIKVAPYSDSRATEGVEVVLAAIIASAQSSLSGVVIEDEVRADADAAGRDVLSTQVVRYPLPNNPPTTDYTEFVRSDLFEESVNVAATAASEEAVFERVNNSLFTPNSIYDAARLAAVRALRDTYGAAARAIRTELPLAGTFGVGIGDPRLTWNIHQTNGAALTAGALTGTISLPANHPTNPFRHRRHPDHAVGFDVIRNLRIDFDADPGKANARSGFGVDRISGTYREEFFGLHKPLGPDKDIGLRVEGRFELNRISTIDTLNAR